MKWTVFSKWTIFIVVSIGIIILAAFSSKGNSLINEARTVPLTPTFSSATKSSISGTVVFDSTSTNSFSLTYPSKVKMDLQAGHYGVGATITDSKGNHVLDLRFSNILGNKIPSGEFTGDAGNYNVILSGPSSFAPSDVGKPVSYTLSLITYKIITYSPVTETVPITKSAINWTKFYLISVPSLLILLFLVLIIPKHIPLIPNTFTKQEPTASSRPTHGKPFYPHEPGVPFGPGGPGMNTPPPPIKPFVDHVEGDNSFDGNMGYIEPEYIETEIRGLHSSPGQTINNHKLNRLVQEGKLKPGAALEYWRAIKEQEDDPFSQQDLQSLLEAIDHGVESDKPGYDGLPSILKKYGIDPNKFMW